MTAMSISPGGIPKTPVAFARVTINGIEGDGHAHTKHIKPTRALSLIDEEIIEILRQEGYPVFPGTMGENITVRHLNIQHLESGTRLVFSGGVVIELSELRKPCFVLGPIHPALEKETIGRIGYMASVITEGVMQVGETICIPALY